MADGSSVGGWVLHPTLEQLGCSRLLLLPSLGFLDLLWSGLSPSLGNEGG